jgi:aryl-alcohol dehydrogenase-like predicted oxidoreductase
MKHRTLGKTGFEVSEIGLGAWQIGGRWGEDFSEANAQRTLETALDAGVTFIDTADGYGSGLSEKAVGRFIRGHRERVHFATKCGRRLNPHVAEGYTDSNIRSFVDDSLRNMGLDSLDLIQLHCPPTEVYYTPEVFETLDALRREGKIHYYGVSVEKVEEAIKAIEYPNLATVQIVFNILRQRPADLFFELARSRNVGVIVRVPLASGLLTGKFSQDSVFDSKDHRNFNRNGEKFDKGETFAGVDYQVGLDVVDELKKLFPPGEMPQYALRWILMFAAVSCVIPGASRPEQAAANAAASSTPDLDDAQMRRVREIYEEHVKPLVHHRW